MITNGCCELNVASSASKRSSLRYKVSYSTQCGFKNINIKSVYGCNFILYLCK